MAYVNVLDWKAEQVADWLRGLDDVVYPYAHFFLNNDVTGQRLLNMTVDDLYKLHVEKLGHQEIILESLEQLRNFHYNLDQENLQYICLRLSCKARSLYNEMSLSMPKMGEKQVVRAPVMCGVADVLDSVRLLLSWLERKPFDLSHEYHTVRTTLISLSLELATNAQRDTFAEQPMDVIRSCCDKLALIADKVIQDFTDPFILQPASLDVATVRKKAEEELGIVLESGLPGVHLVTETRMATPSARVEPGDEIVQVNYQTVVGWQTKKVVQLMGENPVQLILTLKKRPRHSNLGQIYIKPFRIPARKKSAYYINNLPSPRTELLVVPDVSLPITKKRNPSESSSDIPLSESETDSEDDEAFLPVAASEVAGQIQRHSTASPTQSLRSVLSRPRSAPQRRATISGISGAQFRPYINVSEIWPGMRDTSSEFPSSTLSSKDSGVSTLSKSKPSTDSSPEMREKTGPSPPRPITIAAGVTSAPNLLSLSVINKPRMPEPCDTDTELHVNRIHVTCAPASVPTVTNSVYMNVPKHPEYVNFSDNKHQYVNVLDTTQPSNNKQPLPKPRAPLTTNLEGGRSSTQSIVSDQKTHDGQDIPGSGKTQVSGHRGKRPVPLPRRLSSISSPKQSSNATVSASSPSVSSPNVPKTPVSATSSPTYFFAKSRENSAKKSSISSSSSTTSGSRRSSGADFPTPTANFKSYTRQRVANTEETSGGQRNVKMTPRHKQPAPLPGAASAGSKLKSVTRLSFDSQPPLPSRADSGLGHSSVSSSDSVRLSSVSSVDSQVSTTASSPVRILVKQNYNNKRPNSNHHD